VSLSIVFCKIKITVKKKAKPKRRTARSSASKPVKAHGKRIHRGFLVAFLVLTVVGAGLGVIEFEPGIAGNLADNVLRPVVGDRATIALESAMLGLGDHIKQLTYRAGKQPNANIYTTYSSEPTPALRLAAKNILGVSTGPKKPVGMELSALNYYQKSFPRLTGEGVWNLVNLPQFQAKPLMARTFVRPDPERSYAITALIKTDMKAMSLHAVAGTYYPGAQLGHPGPGVIPEAETAGEKLVAAFNGGFQYVDGHYGMKVGDTTYVPLLPEMGTLTMYKDGTLSIGRYDPKAMDPKAGQIEAMRQNGPMILDQGKVTGDAVEGGAGVWGRTTTATMYTWRSGVGIDKRGDLIYAVGPSLTAGTLAEAMRAGGAQEAMQLDINAFWVRYATFLPRSGGGYTSESILSTLENGGPQYLHGYNKDFFYLKLK
jgi:hypothetical protein